MNKLHLKDNMRELIVLLIVIATLSFSIIYSNVQTYDPLLTAKAGFVDTQDYIKIYNGETINRVRALRLVTPLLARLIPDIPRSLFSTKNRLLLEPDLDIAVKFAAVNLFFLIAAALSLYVLERGFNLNYLEALLGSVLFLGSTTVVRSAGLPMGDVAFYFFFVLCLIAIQKNNWWLLCLAFIAGVFAKEAIFIVAPMVLLTLLPWRRKFVLLCCLIPGAVIYSILLFKMGISPVEENMALNPTAYAQGNIFNTLYHNFIWLFNGLSRNISRAIFINLNGLVKIFLSFGLLWIPALYAIICRDAPGLLKRWSWLLIIIMIVAISLGNIDRIIFNTFPIVIPLAVIGLSKFLALGLDSERKGKR